MGHSEDEDDRPVLSSNALSALKEFYAERDSHVKRFEALQSDADADEDGRGGAVAGDLSIDSFAENWQESQFWYEDETARALADELLGREEAWKGSRIAVVSAPSVFVQMKNILKRSGREKGDLPEIYLLEYDRRFEVFGKQFIFYDFNAPVRLPSEMKGTVDHIICDPPFLSEDCQTKAAMTVRWLSKAKPKLVQSLPQSTLPGDEKAQKAEHSRLIVCTGERMHSIITRLYKAQDIRTTSFLPVHNKQQLSNEFSCYANFECGRWTCKD